jgi:hypothetical protein
MSWIMSLYSPEILLESNLCFIPWRRRQKNRKSSLPLKGKLSAMEEVIYSLSLLAA